MNKYIFILKFITNKQSRGKYNWNIFFPFAGVIIGCTTVALTLSIMEGMEFAIFTKLEKVSFPAKLTNIGSKDINNIEQYLSAMNIKYQYGKQSYMVKNNSIQGIR